MPTLNPTELNEIIDWKRDQIQAQKNLKENKLFQFIQLVASFANIDVKRYTKVQNPNTGASFQSTANANAGGAIAASPRPQPGIFSPSRDENRKTDLSIFEKNKKLGAKRTIWDLLEDNRYHDSIIKQLRQNDQHDALTWIDDTSVFFFDEISELIIGNRNYGY